MTDCSGGFIGDFVHVPAFGRRVADALGVQMRARMMGIGEVSRLVGADKRDVRRLLTDGTCGPRLWDALAQTFRWDFIEAVMTPVIGADPLTSREQEIARELHEIAVREARVARARAADRARLSASGGHLRLVAEEAGEVCSRHRVMDRDDGPPSAQPA